MDVLPDARPAANPHWIADVLVLARANLRFPISLPLP
jgi:hypothetical protein